jgi:hypothetical protein
MSAIQITFTHAGKKYSSELSQVQGAGETSVYHLMIDDYYKGRLRLSVFDKTDGCLMGSLNSWLRDLASFCTWCIG